MFHQDPDQIRLNLAILDLVLMKLTKQNFFAFYRFFLGIKKELISKTLNSNATAKPRARFTLRKKLVNYMSECALYPIRIWNYGQKHESSFNQIEKLPCHAREYSTRQTRSRTEGRARMPKLSACSLPFAPSCSLKTPLDGTSPYQLPQRGGTALHPK